MQPALTDEVTDVPVDKTWTITFNFPVIESSITPDSIYVMNSKQEKQDVTLFCQRSYRNRYCT